MAEPDTILSRVMVIGAHPDDPEFGAGGTIGKWAKAGKEIVYVLLTSGDKGSHDPAVRPGQLATRREAEQRAAAAVLGVKDVLFFRYPDGVLENTMLLRAQLAKLIRQLKPHIVLAIDPWKHYQMAPDHRAAGFAALDAIYAAREWNIFAEQLVADEDPWRVSEAYLYWTDNADYWEDVSETIELRVEALACHASQIKTETDKLRERIYERARKVGEQARKAAEAAAEDGGGEQATMEFAEEFKFIKF
jgi:LmbE family N-acetylglucosaminyl deacetylase